MEPLTEELRAAILARWPEAKLDEVIQVESEFSLYPPPVSKPPPVSNMQPMEDFEPHMITDNVNWETLELGNDLKIRVARVPNAHKVFVIRSRK